MTDVNFAYQSFNDYKIRHKGGFKMQDVNVNEIAQKLNLTPEQVKSSDTVQSTYYEIKNNPDISEEDKEIAYEEISNFYKSLIQNNQQ